jgi:hypothetical protein
MSAAIFALAGTLVGVAGTLAIDLTRARVEDARARRDTVRLACADFTAAVARIRALAFEMRGKQPDGEEWRLMQDAHREARVHFERLRLTAASPDTQKVARQVLRYAYGMIRQIEGKPPRADEAESGPLRMLHVSLMALYAAVRRDIGIPRPGDVYEEPDAWLGEITP